MSSELSRRDFIEYAGLAAIAPGTLVDRLSSPEALRPAPFYGLAQTEVPGRRHMNITENPLGTFEFGTLFRYNLVPEAPQWAKLIQDRGRPLPHTNRASKEIFVSANLIKPLTAQDVAPFPSDLSPGDKRIEIILAKPQRLLAYERGQPVYETPVSAGRNSWTPQGEFRVQSKRWARYMHGADYDLPGVPFVQYFHWKGLAIHAAYWRKSEQFGSPYSHGCINVPAEAAQWLWRWTTPSHADFAVEELKAPNGTLISIHG